METLLGLAGRFWLSFVCVLALAWSAGCTTSTTHLQSARALEPGEVQVTAAASVPASSSVVDKSLDAADTLAERFEAAEGTQEPITAEEQRLAVETALALVAFQPSVVGELVGRVGVYEDIDVGLRLSSQLVKGDAKWQLWEGGSGQALAVSLGYGYHLDVGPSLLKDAFALFEYVELGDFARHDLDLALSWSKDWGEWLTAYGAARYLASFISLDTDIREVETETGTPRTDLAGRIHHYGLTGGAFIGYRYVYLNLELSVLRVAYQPVVLGDRRDLDGFLFAPTAGLTAKF